MLNILEIRRLLQAYFIASVDTVGGIKLSASSFFTVSDDGTISFNESSTPVFAKVYGTSPITELTQFTTKAYVDTIASGFKPKTSVICATTANITLSGEQTIDGITTSSSRVLVKNQSTSYLNGIYVSSSGSWTRSSDMDSWDSEVPGALVAVTSGTTNSNTTWVCNSSTGGTLGVTSINFALYAISNYTHGTGININGNIIEVEASYLSNWNSAYGWGNHASAGYYVGTSATIRALISNSATGLTYNNISGAFSLTSGYAIPTTAKQTQWDTAYIHSQNNDQAHSDYLKNNANDTTSGILTSSGYITSGVITSNGGGNNYFYGKLGINATPTSTYPFIISKTTDYYSAFGDTGSVYTLVHVTSGSWARNYAVRDATDTAFASFGAFGTGQMLNYLYIGAQKSYNATQLRIYPAAPTGLLTLNEYGVGINNITPSYAVDVTGSIRATTNIYTNFIYQYTTAGIDIYASNGIRFQNSLGVDIASFETSLFKVFKDAQYSLTLGSPTFVSGWSGAGWRINTNDSSLEIDGLMVRGTMSVYELLIQQIRATNGNVVVSASAKVASITTATVGSEVLEMEDPNNNNLCPFSTNDLVMVQRLQMNQSTVVKRIIRRVASVSGKTITLTAASGAPVDSGIYEVGDEIVRFGNSTTTSRQGLVYMTADDSNAPYIDIVSGVDSWNTWTGTAKVKARLGRLDGITDTDAGLIGSQSNYYGLYSNNVHLKGHIFSQSGSIAGWEINSTTLNKGNIILDSANEQLRIGSGASATSTSGIFFDGNGVFNIATGAGNYIRKTSTYLSVNSTNFYLQATNGGNIGLGATSFLSGNGVWLSSISYDSRSETGRFRVGNSGASRMEWNDTNLLFYNSSNQNIVSIGAVNTIAGWSITTSELSKSTLKLNASSTPYIALGATSYSVGNGIWLSIASGTKFRVGNASGTRIQWNDTNLEFYNSENTKVVSIGETAEFTDININGRLTNQMDEVVLTGNGAYTLNPTSNSFYFKRNVPPNYDAQIIRKGTGTWINGQQYIFAFSYTYATSNTSIHLYCDDGSFTILQAGSANRATSPETGIKLTSINCSAANAYYSDSYVRKAMYIDGKLIFDAETTW